MLISCLVYPVIGHTFQRPFLSLRIPLEKDIHQILISAFTGYAASSELEGELLSLPVRLVGIGLANQDTSYPHTFSTSKYWNIQILILPCGSDSQTRISPCCRFWRGWGQMKLPKPSMTNIPLDTYIIVLILLQRKGTSSRLAILPLYDYGFYLHKEEFCDSLCLRYEWSLTNTSQTCNCAATLTVCHAMVCHMGGFTTQHNKIWDIISSLVTEVCHNVTTKPHLQPIRGKRLTIQLANTDNNARTHVCARRFRNTKCTGHIT